MIISFEHNNLPHLALFDKWLSYKHHLKYKDIKGLFLFSSKLNSGIYGIWARMRKEHKEWFTVAL